MAKSCAGCGYYAAADEAECPTCKRPLQFTLLPPRNAEDKPAIKLPPQLSSGPARGSLNRGQGSFDLVEFCMKNRMLVGIFVAPILLLAGFVFGAGSGAAREKYDAIKVGMTPAQVESILRKRSGFVSMSKMSQVFSADGSGEMEWSAGGVTITVHFQGGRVVRKSQSGLPPAS
jgi:hypothetical protein